MLEMRQSKFENFLKENPTWKAFLKEYKKDFTEIKDRLVEFSKKIDCQ